MQSFNEIYPTKGTDRLTERRAPKWHVEDLAPEASGAENYEDWGMSIGRAAFILGCSESTAFRLIQNGQLSGWRNNVETNRRGPIRVSSASVEAYKKRNRIVPKVTSQQVTNENLHQVKAEGSESASHRAALSKLKELGVT